MGWNRRTGVVAALVAGALACSAVVASASATASEPGKATAATVLVVGDSLVAGAADELRADVAGHGIETHILGHPGEGLLTAQARWNRQITDAVDRFDPDVVVLEACCNYDPAAPYVLPSGQAIRVDSQAMYDQWAAVARDAVRRASARGAAVYWVVTPDTVPHTFFSWLQPRIDRFNDIYHSLGTGLIDWRAAIRMAPASVVRAPDGLHLTNAGDREVATVTWKVIAPDLR